MSRLFISSPVVKQIAQESTTTEDKAIQDPVLGMEVEIPFVPASQRKPTQVVEDSIVVVGQARQKKRKRTKAVVEDAAASRSADGSNAKKTRQEVNPMPGGGVPSNEEPFDFSAVPNILDNNPDMKESAVKAKKKQRKQKSGMCFNQRTWCQSTLSLQVKRFTETFLLRQKHTVNSSAEINHILLRSE